MSHVMSQAKRSAQLSSRSFKSCSDLSSLGSRSFSNANYAPSLKPSPTSTPSTSSRPNPRSRPLARPLSFASSSIGNCNFVPDPDWSPEIYPPPFPLPNSSTSRYQNFFKLGSSVTSENYTVLRVRAIEEKSTAVHFFNAFRKSYVAGYNHTAEEHYQNAHAHWEQSVKLHHRAMDQAYRTVNRYSPHRTIDLHHLLVVEAEWVVKWSIKVAKDLGISSLKFIVGRGNHSEDNEAKIKPAIEQFLATEGFKYHIPDTNEGIISVQIPMNSPQKMLQGDDDGWTSVENNRKKSPPPHSFRTLEDF